MRYTSLSRCEEREVSIPEARMHVSQAASVAVGVRLASAGREAVVGISKAAAGRLLASAAARGVKVVLLAEMFGQLVIGA
jgi:hypothetical protein